MKFKHQFKLDRADKHTRLYRSDGILMRIDFIEDILRVALIKNEDLLPTFSIDPAHQGTGIRGRDKLSLDGFKLCAPEVHEDHEKLCFRHCGHDFTIDLLNFHITISNDKGILYEDRSGLAYNFDHELGDGSIHYTGRQEGQRIYGLGDKAGPVDKNHQRYKLDTNDSMGYKAKYSDPLYKYLPFYICENQAGSYGIYYDTYSEGEVDFGKEHDNYYEPFNSIRYEEENMVFYLILGDTREIISRCTLRDELLFVTELPSEPADRNAPASPRSPEEPHICRLPCTCRSAYGTCSRRADWPARGSFPRE